MGCASGKEKVSTTNCEPSVHKVDKLEAPLNSSPVITPPLEVIPPLEVVILTDNAQTPPHIASDDDNKNNDYSKNNVETENLKLKRTRTSIALVADKILVAKDTNIAVLNETEGGEVLSVNQ